MFAAHVVRAASPGSRFKAQLVVSKAATASQQGTATDALQLRYAALPGAAEFSRWLAARDCVLFKSGVDADASTR